MPYTQKHTWIFAGNQKGWSESLYIEGVAGTIEAGRVIAFQVAPLRAQLLGAGLYIKAIRIQAVEDGAGNPLKRRGDTFQGLNFSGVATEPAAAPDLSALIDYVNAVGDRHRVGYLGGIWDSISTNFGSYTPSPLWNTALIAWQAKILSFGYGWKGRTPGPDFVLSGYTQQANGQVLLTCQGTPFATEGTAPFVVRVHDLPSVGGKSLLNGDLVVTKNSDSTCTTVARIAVTPFVADGFLNKFTYSFQEIGNLGVEKIVSRERGAPLLESPGRRRARPRT